ncbi:MAG: cardiolipin synthase [Thermoleophilia bacterium]|nr:cardiolipin synthase [Thermoleophilia bacterium]
MTAIGPMGGATQRAVAPPSTSAPGAPPSTDGVSFTSSAAPYRAPVAGPGWKLHTEATAPRAIYDAINGAKDVVEVEFFGIADNGNGAHITDALVAAANRGVEVRAIVDMSSIATLPPTSFTRFLKRTREAGVDVKVTNSIPGLRGMLKPDALQNVTHRKVVVVDGTHAFVGGMNLFKQTDTFRDAMVEMNGADGGQLAVQQLARWRAAGGTVTPKEEAAVAQALRGAALTLGSKPAPLKIISNAPEAKRFELTDTYLDMIRSAKQRLWITSPGFSDKALIKEIGDAAARGVDVRIVTPGSSDVFAPLRWVNRAHGEDLAKLGASVYETAEMIHMKAIVADDRAVVSSFNITGRSRAHDQEIGVSSSQPEMVAAVSRLLQEDMGRSTQLRQADFDNRGVDVAHALVDHLGFSY